MFGETAAYMSKWKHQTQHVGNVLGKAYRVRGKMRYGKCLPKYIFTKDTRGHGKYFRDI